MTRPFFSIERKWYSVYPFSRLAGETIDFASGSTAFGGGAVVVLPCANA